MVDHAGSPHSVNESTVVRRGHTASPVHIVRRTVDDFAAIGHWQPSQQSDPMDILPESRASVNPGVADDLYPLPTGCTADDNLNSSFSGELLEALDNAGYSGHQKPHGHNLVMLAEGIPQPSIGLPPQMHSDYDSAPQRDMYLNQPAPVGLWSVLPVSEAPSNGYFQGNTSVAPATDSHGLLDSLRQPLQHYCTGTANNAPWNSQCHRPFTGHCLVNHPYSEGYGCFPKQQDVTANFGPIIQGGNMNSHYDNAPQGVPFGYTAGSCNFYGSRPILSRVMTAPGAHGPHSTSKSTAILASNQLKLPPPRTEKLPTTGTWIDFDARTGDPLPTGKIRRPRSVEEKAVTQQVKELGGPCDKCRGGKRKCDPAHRRMNTGTAKASRPSKSMMVQTSKSSEIITEPMSRYALARSASEHAGQVTHPGTAVPKFSTPAKLHQDGLAITTSEFPSSLISPEQPSQPMEPFNPRITAFGNSGINGQALRQEKTILVPFQTQPDSTMSSDETFQSCSNESSPWTYMSHETPNTGDLNFHRNVLILGTPPDPTSLPLDDLEAELAFFDMDLFGIGEQFAGYD